MDPGWFGSLPIIELTFDGGGSAGAYAVPDGFTALPQSVCSYASTSTEVHDAKGYQSSLSVDAKLDASGSFLKGLAFSGSYDYQRVKKGTSSDDAVYVSSSAVCYTYTISQLPFVTLNLTRTFRAAVATLTAEYQAAPYAHFVEYFGTHYTSQARTNALSTVLRRHHAQRTHSARSDFL